MNKKAILLVFAMFGIPVVIATLMHSQWIDWAPGGTRNHGTLITPVIEWQAENVQSADGATIGRESLQGKWHLVLHAKTPCGEECMEALYWLRQVRLSQDRHVPEIGLLFLHEPPLNEQDLSKIRDISPNYQVVSGEDARLLGSQFPAEGEGAHRYILDPMANIIMSYTPDQAPDDVRKDLGRLLTWTQTP